MPGISFEHEGYIDFRVDRGGLPQNIPPLIRKIVMRLTLPSISSLDAQPAFVWSNLDWAIVGRTLSSFPGLRRVIIGLDTREDMIDFGNVARVHMSRLHGTGVFKYALWDQNEANRHGPRGTWLRASLDSDETECMLLCPRRHSYNSFRFVQPLGNFQGTCAMSTIRLNTLRRSPSANI